MLYVIELSVFIITVLSFFGVCVLCPIFFFFFFFFFFWERGVYVNVVVSVCLLSSVGSTLNLWPFPCI